MKRVRRSQRTFARAQAESLSPAAGFPQRRVELVDIRLDLLAAPLVDDLPPHHRSGVSEAISSRRQRALDVMDAFPDHDFDVLGPLVQHHDVDGLPGFGYPYLDLLDVHKKQEVGTCIGI